MSQEEQLYQISIKYLGGETEIIQLSTTDVSWSMKQYQRNRDTFTYMYTLLTNSAAEYGDVDHIDSIDEYPIPPETPDYDDANEY